ncbi:MAG: dephospho-CoA kinase [Arenicella sp.]|jgi:dephospho-CoA kinase
MKDKVRAYVVGLTGGIGSGKTVASDRFKALGVPIIDTDIIAREVVAPGSLTLTQLVNTFGDRILQKDGCLDRSVLREIAFSSPENKAQLDAITHPAIRIATLKQAEDVDFPYCIVVVPLLSPNSGFGSFMQRVLVVSADKQTKIERVKKRSNLSAEEVLAIMNTQLSDAEREEFADDLIHNDGTIDEAQAIVDQLHEKYLELSSLSAVRL